MCRFRGSCRGDCKISEGVQVLSGSKECLSRVDEEVTSARCRQFGMPSESMGVWDGGNFGFAPSRIAGPRNLVTLRLLPPSECISHIKYTIYNYISASGAAHLYHTYSGDVMPPRSMRCIRYRVLARSMEFNLFCQDLSDLGGP